MASRYQKRHYVDIANLLNRHVREGALTLELEQRLVYDFIAMFGRDNPLFNPDTFKQAIYKGNNANE